MLKFYVVAFALALLGAIAHDAAAQSRQKIDRHNTQHTEQQAAPEQRGTEQAPFIIKIQQPEQTQPKPDRGPNERPDQRSNGWFAGWTLSDEIAFVASLAAFLQVLALIATVGIMIRNGRRQLRAYVFPESASVLDGSMMKPPMEEHNNEPGVIIGFRNSGQTPAYRVVNWGKIEVIEPSKEESLIVPPFAESVFESWVGANGPLQKSVWFGRKLTKEEIADVGTGKLCIYLFGRTEYRDAFKRKRYTNFRFAYAGVFPPPPGVTFNFCGRGNSAN